MGCICFLKVGADVWEVCGLFGGGFGGRGKSEVGRGEDKKENWSGT